MPSIEEAYRRACYDMAAYGDASAEYSGDYIAANDARKREASRKAKDAVRAGFLAVLEEATPHGPGDDRPTKHHQCPDCDDAMWLRARIEGLGK